MCAGDFNEILLSREKLGGALRSETAMREFREVMDDCGFMDLGYVGKKYSWRGKRGDHMVLERLDRALASHSWLALNPATKVQCIWSKVSDQMIIHINLNPATDSPAVDGLEVGTCSNGPTAASMEFKGSLSARFRFDGPAVAQMDLYGSPSSGLSFKDFAVVPGNTIPTNSHFSKGRSLADSLKGLSSAGFVDFGVNSVDKVGSVRSELLILGADNKGTRQMDDGEIGQPNLAVMELKSGCGLPVLGASTMEIWLSQKRLWVRRRN